MVNRVGLIVHYQGKKVIEKCKELDADIYYTSKKQHYSVIYIDANREKEIKKILNNTKGFKHISPTLLFNPEFNYDENPKKKEIYLEEEK